MATIEHPMTTHKNQKQLNVSPQQTNDVIVMSAEDEELVKQQLADMESAPQVASIMDDPVIEAELKKKRALENLVLFNKPYQKKIKVGEIVFTMKILTAHDSDEVYEEVLKLSAEDQITKTGRMLLAAALIEADGIPLEAAYAGPQEIDRILLRRYYVISGWPAPLINNLTKAYKELLAGSEEGFDYDFLD